VGPETIARMSLRDLAAIALFILGIGAGAVFFVENREGRIRTHWREDLDTALKPIVQRLDRIEGHEDSGWMSGQPR
jgi:hypothetical protein